MQITYNVDSSQNSEIKPTNKKSTTTTTKKQSPPNQWKLITEITIGIIYLSAIGGVVLWGAHMYKIGINGKKGSHGVPGLHIVYVRLC